MNLTNEEVKLLDSIVKAASANTIVYEFPAAAATLMSLGYIEGNPALTDADGRIAFRATANGLAAMQNIQAAASALPPAPPVPLEAKAAKIAASHPGFQKISNFVFPAKQRRLGARAGKKYDVDSLELHEAMFVPASEEMPNPKKSLASTISAANKRYASFTPARFFKTLAVEEGQKVSDGTVVAPAKGCYIVRVEPPVAAPAA